MRYRTLVVDDHPLVLHGMKEILTATGQFEVIDAVAHPHRAAQVVREQALDLAIVDLFLGAHSGMDLIRGLVRLSPDLFILAMSFEDETFYGERSLRAGARGYVQKGRGIADVRKAAQDVVRGDLYAPWRDAELLSTG